MEERAALEGSSATHRTIEAVWKMEGARLIAALTRMVRDVGAAEELAQDALVAALERWPQSGIPEKPGAWLMAVARRRAVDLMRQGRRWERKQGELRREAALREEANVRGVEPSEKEERRRIGPAS